MRVLIDIPEYLFTDIKDIRHVDRTEVSLLCNALINGAVLPKGHGRLFDERDIVNGNYKIIGNTIYECETVIEADKG